MMVNSEKRELLQSKLNELISFKAKLSAENLEEFNILKKEILNLLDDNQKLRFNQITFYNITPEYSNLGIDDLPF